MKKDDGFPERLKSRGTCELCGGHGRELRTLTAGDFFGRACAECIRQLRECQVRQFTGTREESEPAE